MDVNKKAMTHFIKELINMEHASTYIGKLLMAYILAGFEDKSVDWDDLLARALDKELKHLDMSKVHTRLAPHLYFLLDMDPC